MWRLLEYLTEKRIEVGEKYDYRYSVLDFVFARLIWEGWLQEEDLVNGGLIKTIEDLLLDSHKQNELGHNWSKVIKVAQEAEILEIFKKYF